MDRVLVTGVAGFIGSHLAEALLREGYKVRGVDCFTNYYAKSIKEKNLEKLKQNENFEFILADLNSVEFPILLKDISVVYHEAAQAGVRYSWGEHFPLYFERNILATLKILEACKENKQKVVFASSSSVYGNVNDLPMRENSELEPISPYGLTKVACENLCYSYYKNFSVPSVVLRYFTVYGPRQRPDMAISIFTKKLLTGEEIEVYGTGEQTRDFTYVDDIVEGTILAGESNLQFEILNLGGGSQISIKKLIVELEKVTGKTANVKYSDEQRGDMKHTLASIEKAKSLIGYKPKVSIQEGLEKYVEWYNNEFA